jgi:hypothetical protein
MILVTAGVGADRRPQSSGPLSEPPYDRDAQEMKRDD